jgi:hypothetical protein
MRACQLIVTLEHQHFSILAGQHFSRQLLALGGAELLRQWISAFAGMTDTLLRR